jgi:prepilin-type N-terminal cleavage/methylation domain-containing protein
MHTTLRKPRAGFTLVELLVVITLMLVLAGLAVLIIPSITSGQQATNGAAQLQQWLEIAKQRAARDRRPRGLRLLPGSSNPAFVTDLVFLVEADDYYLGAVSVTDAQHAPPPPNPASGGGYGQFKKIVYSRATLSNNAAGQGIVTFDMFDPLTGAVNPAATPIPRTLTAGLPPASANQYPVQPGDHIVFDNGSTVYQIAAVTPPAGAIRGGTLTLTTAFPVTLLPAANSTYKTLEYRIIRQPRPDGDEPLQLPANIIVDVSAQGLGYDLPVMANPGLDVMFSPDGRVMGPLAGYDKIIFWVRDQTVPGDQNDPTLVVVYPRTGLIAAHPVDLTNYNSVTGKNTTPYTFTKSGLRSSE